MDIPKIPTSAYRSKTFSSLFINKNSQGWKLSAKKKSSFSKLHWTTKILIVYLIKKFILILFFAQKMVEFWLFFLFCFWGLLKLLRSLKKVQILDSWHWSVPKEIRHWIRLVWKNCPVSTALYSSRISIVTRVSVQVVKSLGGHFACLCRGFEFYEVK